MRTPNQQMRRRSQRNAPQIFGEEVLSDLCVHRRYVLGRKLDFLVSPQYIGGTKGGNSTCVYTVANISGGLRGVKRLWNKRLSLS
jgi:hypothetical protein